MLLVIITQVMFDQKDGSSKVAGSNPGADRARWFSGEGDGGWHGVYKECTRFFCDHLNGGAATADDS